MRSFDEEGWAIVVGERRGRRERTAAGDAQDKEAKPVLVSRIGERRTESIECFRADALPGGLRRQYEASRGGTRATRESFLPSQSIVSSTQ